MREIYRGNGFVVTTNDSGEIFVAPERFPTNAVRITSSAWPHRMTISYQNTAFSMVPVGMKSIEFVLPSH